MAWVDEGNAALLTDLYELTMASSYHRQGMNAPATFDLFVRELPPNRNFLVASGLEFALDFLATARFDDDALAYLASLEMFSAGFLDYLRTWRFTGEVCAVAEGELVWPPEPLLTVTAPLMEAQIVESFLLNCMTFSTMIASKAARVAIAAKGRRFDDFSLRRDHGADAALKAPRAAFIAGAGGTSNVLAGKMFGIPVSGTMAHSYVMAFDDETEAFRQFAGHHPGSAVLLIDTFDTEEGARRAAQVAAEMKAQGIGIRGVRLDSGDLGSLARSVRAILDAAGHPEITIFASGDLDEYRVAELVDAGAPIDGFGVGTQLGTSADAPSLGGVYKLVDYNGRPVVKLSSRKTTLPGRKQIRRAESSGRPDHDVIALQDEDVAGRPLLDVVMQSGRRIGLREPLTAMRRRCEAAIRSLPEDLRALERAATPFEVRRSPGLDDLVARVARGDANR
jgi:nicotinate phosphoribosyltransferase